MLWLAISVLLTISAAVEPPPSRTASVAPSLVLTPCRVPGVAEELRCGTLNVPEDRARRDGRHLELRVVVMPATGSDKRREPILYLAGGPGQAATRAVAAFAKKSVRQNHDVVFVDQRGTADAHALACDAPTTESDIQSYFKSSFEIGEIRRCRSELASRADLRRYGSADVIADLEDLRTALGYEKILLWGISGGTRMAMLYALHDSASIRGLILSGVAAPQFRNPLPHARSAEQAFQKLAAACDTEAACHASFLALHAKLDSVLARLAIHPATTRVRHPETHQLTSVTIQRDAFADGIRTLMYSSGQARYVPALIERSYSGDLHPMAEFMLARARSLRGSIAMGVLLDIVCGEDVSRIRMSDVATATRGTYLGAGRVREQIAACQAWGAPSPPYWFTERTRLNTPVLFISGELDPVTPPEWADSAAVFFTHTSRVRMRGGHGVTNACTDSLVAAFVADPAAQVDTSCASTVGLPPFATMNEMLTLADSP